MHCNQFFIQASNYQVLISLKNLKFYILEEKTFRDLVVYIKQTCMKMTEAMFSSLSISESLSELELLLLSVPKQNHQ